MVLYSYLIILNKPNKSESSRKKSIKAYSLHSLNCLISSVLGQGIVVMQDKFQASYGLRNVLFITESQDGAGWEGPQWDIWSNLLLTQEHPRAQSTGLCPDSS